MTELEKLKHEMLEAERAHQIAARRWLQARLMYLECFERLTARAEQEQIQ